MKKLSVILISLIFALSSASLVAQPKDKGDKGKEMHGDKGKGKADDMKGGKDKGDEMSKKGRSKKEEMKAKVKGKKDKLRGIENAVAQLTRIADELDKKGKKEQAERIRAKIKKLEEKMAKKKEKVKKEEEEADKLPDDA